MPKLNMPKYVLKTYKTNITDFRKNDKPFEIEFDSDWEPKLISGVERGLFTLTKIPYGFYLYGFGGENIIIVQYSSGQSGTTKITVVLTAVDLGQTVKSAHVNWDDTFIAINDLINQVYFGSM